MNPNLQQNQKYSFVHLQISPKKKAAGPNIYKDLIKKLMQNCIKISSRQKTLAIERKPAAKCKSMNSGKSHIRQHPSNFPCRHFWYFFPLSGKNPSEAQNPWDPGPLRVWGFPTEQLWAVHHQLRQREAPAGLHWGDPCPRAGGVPQWRSWMDPGTNVFSLSLSSTFTFTAHFLFLTIVCLIQ